MDILSNYQGYKKMTLILVFDAYRVEGHEEEIVPYHNIHVVYTKEAETADSYIERTAHQIGRKYQVTVATSDGLEQMIIWGEGALRMSAPGFLEEVRAVSVRAQEQYLPNGKQGFNRIRLEGYGTVEEQENKEEDKAKE